MPESFAEKRKFERLNIQTEVIYNKEAATEKEKKSFSRNISQGGICLIVYEKLEISDILKLTILLPDGIAPIQATGRVAWVKNFSIEGPFGGGEKYDVGIEFIKINKEERTELEKYLFTYRKINQ